MELASQASPRPAASPPSIAPHGRLCGAAAAGEEAGVAGVAFCAGLVPCVWETLLDCWPTDLPEPMRFAASALKL